MNGTIHQKTTAHQQLLRSCATKSQTPRLKPQFQASSGFDSYHLILICPITCFCLCYWQLQRKKWKTNLIGMVECKLSGEPQLLPEDPSELEELTPIKVRGHFDYTNEVFIGPRSMVSEFSGERGSGVHVITPFVLADRELTILVNRGFYPTKSYKDNDILKAGQHHGEREITGVIRKNQETISFLKYVMDMENPTDRFGHDLYPARKLAVLANRCGTSEVYIDATDLGTAQKNAPVLAPPGADFRDKHHEYAAFWLFLGLITLCMYIRQRSGVKKQMTSIKGFIDDRSR